MEPILVGEEKAVEHFSKNLHSLTELSLDSIGIASVQITPFIMLFSNVQRISLCGNLITRMDHIIDLANAWPNLKEIDLSSNLNLTSCDHNIVNSNIIRLNISNCPNMSLAVLHLFPNLKALRIDGVIVEDINCPPLTHVTTLSMARCSIEWTTLKHVFPNSILSLDISNNPLGDYDTIDLPTLTHLNIASTNITTWSTIRAIAKSVPLLESIRITGNFVYDSALSRNRQILITTFPKLTSLNGATVSSGQRSEAERYCANLIQIGGITKELSDELKFFIQNKYFSPKHIELVTQNKRRPNEVKSNMISLVVRGGRPSDLVVRIPISCKISNLSSVIAKRIEWPLKISQLGLSVCSPAADFEDRTAVSGTGDVSDLGLEDGWIVYTYILE